MEETNELVQERIKKLNRLRDAGVEPYGVPFAVKDRASDIIDRFGELSKEEIEERSEKFTIAGRIISFRNFGKTAFAHIQDASGKIQVYFSKDIIAANKDIFKNLDIGDIIGVNGLLFRTKTGELTVKVNDFTVLCKSLRPLPEKWHGLKDIETRCRQRYVDLIVNPHIRELFTKRSRLIQAIRKFFDNRGFLEVETPMMHQIPGGATARPFKTHHNALGIDLYLRIAPELYLKKLLVGGYEKVYEINKNFRNEGISSKHNPEFTMLEFYISYKDYSYLMGFTEELISSLCKEINGDLRVPFGESSETGEGEIIDFTSPWPRLSMVDAMEEQGVDPAVFRDAEKAKEYADKKNFGIDKKAGHGKILDEIFKKKVEPRLIQPTFITDYPVELSPLAKRKKDAPEFVERFELFIGGREVANAFSELNDPVDQRERFLEQAEARKQGDEEANFMDEDFVRALEYGMPPAAGEGIGIDRLFMLLTNTHSIRDVILFPHLRPEK
ncbi:MAG TPA: lysine--tRNA ligase [Nitrospirae bacterium]|nr:lysine--tRNA ligase [bacterium BMS3Abin06]HDH11452.1 lysine--tRNA ligase [Nitrospirota bacterium]HDZ01394.1 lysine--tRNA ligase [Nitrospirota bacterium]